MADEAASPEKPGKAAKGKRTTEGRGGKKAPPADAEKGGGFLVRWRARKTTIEDEKPWAPEPEAESGPAAEPSKKAKGARPKAEPQGKEKGDEAQKRAFFGRFRKERTLEAEAKPVEAGVDRTRQKQEREDAKLREKEEKEAARQAEREAKEREARKEAEAEAAAQQAKESQRRDREEAEQKEAEAREAERQARRREKEDAKAAKLADRASAREAKQRERQEPAQPAAAPPPAADELVVRMDVPAGPPPTPAPAAPAVPPSPQAGKGKLVQRIAARAPAPAGYDPHAIDALLRLHDARKKGK
jgi:hypothetical protein